MCSKLKRLLLVTARYPNRKFPTYPVSRKIENNQRHQSRSLQIRIVPWFEKSIRVWRDVTWKSTKRNDLPPSSPSKGWGRGLAGAWLTGDWLRRRKWTQQAPLPFPSHSLSYFLHQPLAEPKLKLISFFLVYLFWSLQKQWITNLFLHQLFFWYNFFFPLKTSRICLGSCMWQLNNRSHLSGIVWCYIYFMKALVVNKANVKLVLVHSFNRSCSYGLLMMGIHKNSTRCIPSDVTDWR